MEEYITQKKDQDRYLGRRKLKGSNNISSRGVGMSKNSEEGGESIMWWIIFILILKAVEHLFKFDFKKAVIPIFGNSYGDQSAVFVGSGLAVGSKSCLAAISIKIPFEKRVTPLLLLKAVGTEGQGG